MALRLLAVMEVLHNSYNMDTCDVPEMYAKSARVQPKDYGHTFQANYSCPCYNYKLCTLDITDKQFIAYHTASLNTVTAVLEYPNLTALLEYLDICSYRAQSLLEYHCFKGISHTLSPFVIPAMLFPVMSGPLITCLDTINL